MPVYSFLIADGASHTKDNKKYVWKYIAILSFLACVSEVPYDLFNTNRFFVPTRNNVIFTHLIGYLTCLSLDQNKGFLWKSFVILIGGITAELLRFNYGLMGVVLITGFYLILKVENPEKRNLLYPVLLLIFGAFFVIEGSDDPITFKNVWKAFRTFYYSQLGVFLSLPFILSYNGDRSKETPIFKTVYRFFYPVHFLILLLLEFAGIITSTM
jgi:hypothetical protein